MRVIIAWIGGKNKREQENGPVASWQSNLSLSSAIAQLPALCYHVYNVNSAFVRTYFVSSRHLNDEYFYF